MRFADTVTIVRAPLLPEDVFGNQQRDWGNAVDTVVSGHVQPDRETETITNEQRVQTWLRVFLPASTDIVETDRVEWRTGSYEVEKVEPWYDLAARARHVEVLISQVTE